MHDNIIMYAAIVIIAMVYIIMPIIIIIIITYFREMRRTGPDPSILYGDNNSNSMYYCDTV